MRNAKPKRWREPQSFHGYMRPIRPLLSCGLTGTSANMLQENDSRTPSAAATDARPPRAHPHASLPNDHTSSAAYSHDANQCLCQSKSPEYAQPPHSYVYHKRRQQHLTQSLRQNPKYHPFSMRRNTYRNTHQRNAPCKRFSHKPRNHPTVHPTLQYLRLASPQV